MPTDTERMDYLQWVVTGPGRDSYMRGGARSVMAIAFSDWGHFYIRDLLDRLMKDYPRPADAD